METPQETIEALCECAREMEARGLYGHELPRAQAKKIGCQFIREHAEDVYGYHDVFNNILHCNVEDAVRAFEGGNALVPVWKAHVVMLP